MISSGRGGSGGYCIPLLCGARPARYPGSVAGERRRPAASTKAIEPEDMTDSLLRIGAPADPRRARCNPRLRRSQRPAAAADPLPLRGPDLAEEKPFGPVNTPTRRPIVRESSSELMIDRSLVSRALRNSGSRPPSSGTRSSLRCMSGVRTNRVAVLSLYRCRRCRRCWILVCKRRSAPRLRASLVGDAQRAARLMHSAARSMP